jgi:hypothetical protein
MRMMGGGRWKVEWDGMMLRQRTGTRFGEEDSALALFTILLIISSRPSSFITSTHLINIASTHPTPHLAPHFKQ